MTCLSCRLSERVSIHFTPQPFLLKGGSGGCIAKLCGVSRPPHPHRLRKTISWEMEVDKKYIYIYVWYRLVLNHKKTQLHPSYCCTLSVRRPSPAVTFARLNARKGVAPRVDALYLSGVGATGRIGYIGINISLFFYALEMYLGLSMATVFFWVPRYIISL